MDEVDVPSCPANRYWYNKGIKYRAESLGFSSYNDPAILVTIDYDDFEPGRDPLGSTHS